MLSLPLERLSSSVLVRFNACGCTPAAQLENVPLVALGAKPAEKKKEEPDLLARTAKILDKIQMHTGLINANVNYRASVVPAGSQHPLYSFAVPFMISTAGNFFLNSVLMQKPISFVNDNKPFMLYALYWALVNKCPGDVFYRTIQKCQTLKDIFLLLDSYAGSKGMCNGVGAAVDKYPHAPITAMMTGIVGGNAGAAIGFLDARTRDPNAKWLLSRPTTLSKLISGSAVGYVVSDMVLRKILPIANADARKAAARRINQAAIMSLMIGFAGYTVVTKRLAKKAAPPCPCAGEKSKKEACCQGKKCCKKN